MNHIGIICPNAPGHLNPMLALAGEVARRGSRVTFFLLGDEPAAVAAAGFECVPVGGSIFPPEEYRESVRQLGELSGGRALKQTFAIGDRSAEAILELAPEAVRSAGVTALIVDQAATPGGTVADLLGLPFVTLCNALLLHRDPAVPPFFTSWKPRQSPLARLRNRAAWWPFGRLYAPILKRIRERRRKGGLSIPGRIGDCWSQLLQLSQQPAAFEFPRRELPASLRFVGPLLRPAGPSPVPFPWEKLDGRPLIYASLGTIQNRVADTYRTIAESCSGLGAQVVISTGGGIDPASLGTLPGDPIVVHYAPQRDLVRRACLVVTHAGLNTVLETLSEGVPLVAIPIANEQPGVAARVAWVGAGEVLPLKRLTAGKLRTLIERVRGKASYRSAAERVRESIRCGGGIAKAAELIEETLIEFRSH